MSVTADMSSTTPTRKLAPSADPLWPQLALFAAVSASHMSLPNHWLPYSLVERARGWSLRKTLLLTLLSAIGRVANTTLITVLISEIVGPLISHEHYRLLSSGVLFLGGLYYLYTYFVQRNRSSCSAQPLQKPPGESDAVHRTAEISLVLLTTLSPCVGSMPVLVSVMASPIQSSTVTAAAAVLLATSAFVMCSLVTVSFLSAAKLDFANIRRHERLLLGAGLLLLAVLTFFLFDGNHAHHYHHPHLEAVQRPDSLADSLTSHPPHYGH